MFSTTGPDIPIFSAEIFNVQPGLKALLRARAVDVAAIVAQHLNVPIRGESSSSAKLGAIRLFKELFWGFGLFNVSLYSGIFAAFLIFASVTGLTLALTAFVVFIVCGLVGFLYEKRWWAGVLSGWCAVIFSFNHFPWPLLFLTVAILGSYLGGKLRVRGKAI